jgi:hypothetical protein
MTWETDYERWRDGEGTIWYRGEDTEENRWNLCQVSRLHISNPSLDCYRYIKKLDEINVKVEFLRLFSEHHAMKAYWGNKDTAPHILWPRTRWKWLATFTPRPLYSQGNKRWVRLILNLLLHTWDAANERHMKYTLNSWTVNHILMPVKCVSVINGM